MFGTVVFVYPSLICQNEKRRKSCAVMGKKNFIVET
jgi:hypothetical protein